LRVSNDNVLYKLKIRHHQNRGALLYGTKQPEHLEEEEEKENEESEPSPKMSFQSRISGIHKVSSIERAERRRERQAGLARLVSKLRQAENATMRDSIWELVTITRENEHKLPRGEKAFVTKEVLRLRNVSSCAQPTCLLFPKPLNCREEKILETAVASEHFPGSQKTCQVFLGPASLCTIPDVLTHPCSSPGTRWTMILLRKLISIRSSRVAEVVFCGLPKICRDFCPFLEDIGQTKVFFGVKNSLTIIFVAIFAFAERLPTSATLRIT